ncbi:MAG: molecular chaperone DnaJ [Nanoarchaeota archaeon]
MNKDYYKTLGIDKAASKEDIKKAYKNLAKKYHPDLNKDAGAESKFKEINEAFSVLADEQKRSQYDQFGPDGFKFNGGQDFSNFGADFDFNDIFESFFGGGFGGGFGSTGRSERRRRGQDLQFDIEITLEEAAFGIKKTFEIKKRDPCEECAGHGGTDSTRCPSCQGSGIYREQRRTPLGIFQTQTTCRECQGQGEAYKNVCTSCSGNGVVAKKKKLEIQIPAGIEEGNQIRLSNEGEAGRGAPPGDLYVRIHIKQHEFFKRARDDIHIDVPISFAQATLGDEITVPTLHGEAKLKIPSGTQTGTSFRMRGKGIDNLNQYGTGDQYVKVYVSVPTKLSKREKEILEEFSKTSGDKISRPQKSFFKSLFT